MQLDHGEVLAEDPSTVKKEHEKRRGEREEKKNKMPANTFTP
jgi:hypothetical protein